MAVIKGNIKKKGKFGFASMDKAKQAAIASKGGKRAHELGHAHEWDSQSASHAGQLGGRNRAKNYANT